MTLYYETDTFAAWAGRPINGIRYPRQIEQLWQARDLEAIGLWRDDMIAAADPVPEGKRIVAVAVERVEGVPTFVYTLEDIVPYVPSTPTLYAVGNFHVDAANFDVTGIETSVKFAAAMWLGPGSYFILLAEVQDDTAYLAKVTPTSGTAYVTEKGTDYMLIQAYDSSGSPADPADFSLEIVRVI